MVLHESGEDYLESILMLKEKLGSVHSIDIVNHLGYSKPSVSIAMKKLRENGYITMAGDGSITLNESGLAIAQKIYNRHKTLTRMLISIGVSPKQAEDDACKIEHDLSSESYHRLLEFTHRCHAMQAANACCSAQNDAETACHSADAETA